MTKTDKKKVVADLIFKFKSSTDISELTTLKNLILSEILNTEYDISKKELIKLSCNVWGADIQDYIIKLESNKIDKIDKFTELAFAGLYNLIDISVLPD